MLTNRVPKTEGLLTSEPAVKKERPEAGLADAFAWDKPTVKRHLSVTTVVSVPTTDNGEALEVNGCRDITHASNRVNSSLAQDI